jgi:hypothetical protein
MTDPEPEASARKPTRPTPWPAIALLVVILAFWGYRRWSENRTHRVVFRANGGQTCRVRVQFDPGAPLDAVEQQAGVLTPWQRELVAKQETELSLRLYGDASCLSITCEIEVDGIVISRKTTETKDNQGVDSASCRALAVDTHH